MRYALPVGVPVPVQCQWQWQWCYDCYYEHRLYAKGVLYNDGPKLMHFSGCETVSLCV